ncbi:MAG: Nif3-like dinuclear metal center hexameric protein [Muribaculaceae bacterium]|nr:Nif3-like dinuclear metal center hexameric protein [Muribaculaceae bacterium]
MLIGHIIEAIESLACPALQESWDNSGLQVGDAGEECTGVMLCVDCTEAVINEAAEKGCNLIVSHHPLIFKGIKHITDSNPTERCVALALRRGIAVYSSHTSLDSAEGGVSYALARSLGAVPERALKPVERSMVKLSIYAPRDRREDILAALDDSLPEGTVTGYDTQKLSQQIEEDENGIPMMEVTHTPLTLIEIVMPELGLARAKRTLAGMGDEISFTTQRLEEADRRVGLGVVAHFDTPLEVADFINRIKNATGAPVVRCNTLPPPGEKIGRIAVCGGAGGEFTADAVRSGADAYLTADVRYHDFGEWAGRILLVDAGHYETESCTKSIFMQLIQEKFANFAVYISATEQNPINYL